MLAPMPMASTSTASRVKPGVFAKLRSAKRRSWSISEGDGAGATGCGVDSSYRRKSSAFPVLGDFEHVVLLALLRLGPEAYGTTIRREIEAQTGRTVSVGALYTALDRFERNGYVTSTLTDPTPERGGRAKRCFEVTPAGQRAVRLSREVLNRMWKGLEPKGERT